VVLQSSVPCKRVELESYLGEMLGDEGISLRQIRIFKLTAITSSGLLICSLHAEVIREGNNVDCLTFLCL
jgi:hypothetical protein